MVIPMKSMRYVLLLIVLLGISVVYAKADHRRYDLSGIYITVASPPMIAGFTPTIGHTGTSVTINGSDFTGATDVKFNGTSASFVVNSTDKISTSVPSGATTGPIQVTTPAGSDVSGSDFVVDNTPPSPPTLASTIPASPANDNNPHILGTAEPLSAVELFTNSGCTGSPAGTGTANGSGNFNIQVTVADNTTTTFFAHARDAAGNISDCSTSGITYVEDSSLPPGMVCGSKYGDLNGNGVFEPFLGETGIAGWMIQAISSIGDTLRTTTDANGH